VGQKRFLAQQVLYSGEPLYPRSQQLNFTLPFTFPHLPFLPLTAFHEHDFIPVQCFSFFISEHGAQILYFLSYAHLAWRHFPDLPFIDAHDIHDFSSLSVFFTRMHPFLKQFFSFWSEQELHACGFSFDASLQIHPLLMQLLSLF